MRYLLVTALWLLVGVGPFALYRWVPRTRRVLSAVWRMWIIVMTWVVMPLGLFAWWHRPALIWPHSRAVGYVVAVALTFFGFLLARSELRWMDERYLKPKHKMQPRVWRIGSQVMVTRTVSGWYVRLWRWRVDTTREQSIPTREERERHAKWFVEERGMDEAEARRLMGLKEK